MLHNGRMEIIADAVCFSDNFAECPVMTVKEGGLFKK
jgi:predicted hotdog family 3-hydroxylacyl-ACP dehydratase